MRRDTVPHVIGGLLQRVPSGRRRLVVLGVAACACAFAPIPRTVGAQSRIMHLRSKVLGEERTIHVSLPANYSVAKQRYQVTYLLDGQVRAFYGLTVAAAGYDLVGDVHDYGIPPQIVIGVEQKDRGSDLGRNQEAFARFLAEELVPFVDHEFRTVPYRTLIGHSLGARFALQSFCRNRGLFPAVIAMSPGFGDTTGVRAVTDCLQREFTANHTVARQLVIIVGGRESRLAVGADRLREFLRTSAPTNWRWTFLDGAKLGHTETPYSGIPQGIRFVHDGDLWEMPTIVADSILRGFVDPDQAIGAWYKLLSARVGYEVAPSAKWLSAAAREYARRPNLVAAEADARRALDAYPEDLNTYAGVADVFISRNDPAAARRTLTDALRVLDRLDFFDETERALKRSVLRESLEKLAPEFERRDR